MQIERLIGAAPGTVYRLLTDAQAVARWKVPDEMTCRIHEFDARPGGRFRVSLTYRSEEALGKSGEHTDTYHGRFVELVPGERVVEEMEFESKDPAMRGLMRITYTLAAEGAGTRLRVVHEGVPDVVAPADNELGWRMSVDKLAVLAREEP
jgi:uncharacterized protein YndB with AHSA1/START domain